ncbi:MAG: FAD-dependent oxidoreductase [Spirochaetia bacterium]|jgi:NAD(P)H-flavin reductase
MGNPVRVKCTISSILKHDEGVYTVVMRPSGRIPKFKPGQFMHLAVDDFDPASGFWPESRVFSIASVDENNCITIVYSVKGKFTARMASCLEKGKQIWVKFPYGDFIIKATGLENDIVLVAGGTGISPFVQYLKTLERDGSRSGTVRLYYGVRKLRHLLFVPLLRSCAEKNLIELRLWIETAGEKMPADQETAFGIGRLNIDRIADECLSLREPVYYLSGPPIMIQSFSSALSDKGIRKEHIRIDEWE